MPWAAHALIGVAAFVSFCGNAAPADRAPIDAYPRAAAAYVLATDDHVLWARNADKPLPPASLAKLLSALVLLRGRWNETEIITISAAAAAIEGTQIGLRAGEKIRAGDALTAMLLRSANDACLALAENAAGSSAEFVRRMQALANELALKHSEFRTPCGLDAPGQYSTANDLLSLARIAMRQPQIAVRAARENDVAVTLGGRSVAFHNNNALIGRLRGTLGVKSGFTVAAGKCVIAMVEREGHRVWLVLLNAPNRWWTADAMIEAAFAAINIAAD